MSRCTAKAASQSEESILDHHSERNSGAVQHRERTFPNPAKKRKTTGVGAHRIPKRRNTGTFTKSKTKPKRAAAPNTVAAMAGESACISILRRESSDRGFGAPARTTRRWLIGLEPVFEGDRNGKRAALWNVEFGIIAIAMLGTSRSISPVPIRCRTM